MACVEGCLVVFGREVSGKQRAWGIGDAMVGTKNEVAWCFRCWWTQRGAVGARRRWETRGKKLAGARCHHEEFQGIGAKVRTGTSVPVRQVGQRLRVSTQARKSEDGVAGSGGGA